MDNDRNHPFRTRRFQEVNMKSVSRREFFNDVGRGMMIAG